MEEAALFLLNDPTVTNNPTIKLIINETINMCIVTGKAFKILGKYPGIAAKS